MGTFTSDFHRPSSGLQAYSDISGQKNAQTSPVAAQRRDASFQDPEKTFNHGNDSARPISSGLVVGGGGALSKLEDHLTALRSKRLAWDGVPSRPRHHTSNPDGDALRLRSMLRRSGCPLFDRGDDGRYEVSDGSLGSEASASSQSSGRRRGGSHSNGPRGGYGALSFGPGGDPDMARFSDLNPPTSGRILIDDRWAADFSGYDDASADDLSPADQSLSLDRTLRGAEESEEEGSCEERPLPNRDVDRRRGRHRDHRRVAPRGDPQQHPTGADGGHVRGPSRRRHDCASSQSTKAANHALVRDPSAGSEDPAYCSMCVFCVQ